MQKLIQSINNCARCRHDHIDVEFERFKDKPIEDCDSVWDYWGICPETNDPILLRVVDTESENLSNISNLQIEKAQLNV